ncbi:MAG: hypothetical protein BGO32_02830 [Bacteroidetes bacterium 37-13]|nr:MAG: hypothetical protein BGO32_02830 [Bacteroidetes bacterium 37-13]
MGSTIHQIHPTKGTIFEKSTTPLLIWFYSMFLFSKSKNGLSASELERQTGVNYKTAWRILMKIRQLTNTDTSLNTGVFELDETFIGGKNKNRHWDKKVANSQGRSFKDKTPVFGVYQRGGKVNAYVVDNTKAESLVPIIQQNVVKDSVVYTDEWTAYSSLNKDYQHSFVLHNRKQYKFEDCCTNGIENFGSVLKRTLGGSYIHVNKEYLQQYVNEVAFRYNNRNSEVFNELVSLISS